jgi:ABA DEFICIENT 4-like
LGREGRTKGNRELNAKRPAGFAKFSTLEGLASLQGSPWLLLAGWLHYLAFDLFVGAWEVRTARRDGIAHLAVVPSLILTFMVGPAGLLVFTVTRLLVRKRPGR